LLLIVGSFIAWFFSSHAFVWQVLMKKILSLGTECVVFLKTARASQGTPIFMSCTCSRVSCGFLLHLPFLLWLVDAFTVANARIAALEAKLSASREAWEGANAAKVAAKSAETKVKKAKKTLVTADQKRVQRERTIAERLDKILALVGGKCRIFVIFGLFAHAFGC
jgi:hypothetical protein